MAGLSAPLRGARLLVVEDNDINQALAVELLGRAGIAVEVVENGQLALDRLARGEAVDGILMDCQMPVMDGYTATRLIRANPAWAALPIVAMTANATAADRARSIEAGMNDHVVKPFDVEDLFGVLVRWIRPGGVRSSGLAAPPIAPVPGEGSPGLPDLPGIDTGRGRANCLYRDDLYRAQLVRFGASAGGFERAYREAMGAGDAQGMARLAHTLKGTAGTIGAAEVERLAALLEARSNAGMPHTRHRILDEVRDALGQVLASIGRLPAQGEAARPREAGGDHAFEALLGCLHARIADADAEAGTMAQALWSILPEGELKLALGVACEALARFDFDAAADALRRHRA